MSYSPFNTGPTPAHHNFYRRKFRRSQQDIPVFQRISCFFVKDICRELHFDIESRFGKRRLDDSKKKHTRGIVMSTVTTRTRTRAAGGPVADRMDRLKAALIDAGIMLAANFPIYLILWMLGAFNYYLVSMVICAAASAIIFMSINYNSLKSNGQTIGKKKMNIRIIGRDDQPMCVDSLLLKRYAPVWLASLIPVVGPLLCIANALCIFRNSNACLHDDVAGSKVVPV